MSLPQSHNQKPGIKREFYPLPEEDPDGWRCVEVHIPDGDEYFELLKTVLKSLTLWFNYARDIEHRGKLIADRFAFSLGLPELGCDMNCEELQECLAPLIADVGTIKSDLEALAAQIAAQIAVNSATAPENVRREGDEHIYAGALALVQQMHKNNMKYYAEAEDSFVDNASEALAIVLELFPKFQGLPYDEAFEIGNAHFTNVAATYAAAFDDMEVPAAFDLYCKIFNNDSELTLEIWGRWLNGLDVLIPANAAASVFAAYAPIRQTFLNQIAAALNSEISLETYFKNLWQIYDAGTRGTEILPVGYECDCEDVYDYATPLPLVLNDGNAAALDPTGYYSSGAYTGFGNPNWIIGKSTTLFEGVNSIRFVLDGFEKNPATWNALVVIKQTDTTETTYIVDDGMTVIQTGSEVEFTITLGTSQDFDELTLNFNHPPAGVFKLLRVIMGKTC